VTEDWTQRAARLADELTAAGKLWSPQWQAAVCAVPRHALVPAYYRRTDHGWERADTSTPEGRARWLDLVYSNTALFTLPDGRSSSSMPGLMTRMLERLDIGDGHRVLEIGTGTGYNTALLSQRLGEDNVFSVDIEPELIALARQRLAALGYHPTLTAADGACGLTYHAPYDRILATCSVPRIPWPWVAQTSPGGLILADLKLATNAGNLVLLRRIEDRAEGHFEPTWGGFMPLRHHTPQPRRSPPPRDRSAAEQRTTSLDLPRPWENLVFWFVAQLLLPSDVSVGQTMDETGQPADGYLATPDGSWCEITPHPDEHGNRRVLEAGPQRLWLTIEDAHRLWTSLGEPGWERFGVTVTREHHRVWLDHPDSHHSWQLRRQPESDQLG